MRNPAAFLLIAIVSLCCGTGEAREPVVGGPCEGCEYVFQGLPGKLESRSRMAPLKEPGEPMIIEGTVRSEDGKPAAGVIVYAYHTDARGIYPPAATRHGRLRAWARTGKDGRYRFDTIRPGAYPDGNNPQHVHMHIIEPGKGTYYIDDIHFTDDPLLTAERRQRMQRGRGGDGLSRPTKDSEGVWHAQRDIVLGRNVPGYEASKGHGR
ncbi:MAG TPA: hypothetical protein VIW92_15230 [Thermoanaerobaculia bacterium]